MDFLLSIFSWLNFASGGFEGDLMEIKWDKVVGGSNLPSWLYASDYRPFFQISNFNSRVVNCNNIITLLLFA